jgi:hypothetical protein
VEVASPPDRLIKQAENTTDLSSNCLRIEEALLENIHEKMADKLNVQHHPTYLE